jgi:hypothetical protein
VAEAQAVYYRAAKIDDHVEEHLNGRPPDTAMHVTSTPQSESCARRKLDRRPHSRAALRPRPHPAGRGRAGGHVALLISKLEAGNHIPTIPVLKRILAVLDEELLIGIERRLPDEEPEREVAPVPELAGV